MDRSRRRLLRMAGTVALLPVIPGRTRAAPPELVGPTMGTRYRVRIGEPVTRSDLPGIRRSIEDVLEDVEQRLSLYREQSELSRLNRGTAGAALPLSPATRELVSAALEMQAKSDGGFNPFTAPLVSRWGFGPGKATESGLSYDNRSFTRWASVSILGNSLRKSFSDLSLDLNGIAKGDAVDRVMDSLAHFGLRHYLVEVGGEVACSGMSQGSPWRVGIRGPNGDIVSRLAMNGVSVATSGDHIHYYLLNGRRYSHLMDPVTGCPVDHDLALVSVVAENTRLADAWSTALMALGPEAARAMAERRRLAALFVERAPDGLEIKRTSAYRDLEEVTS